MKPVLLFVTILLLGNCRFAFDKTVEGSTDIKTEQRNMTGFTGVDVAGPFQVTVAQGADYRVTITADDNLIPYIETRLNGQTLEIVEKEHYNLRGTKGLQVAVQLPTVKSLSLSGSGSISAMSTLKHPSKMDLSLAGSGTIQAELDAPAIHFDLAGSGTATLSGQTRKMEINISGSGDCMADALKSEDCSVSIAGSGNTKVYASQTLNASIAGSGDVYYAGQPKINSSVGGSGKVKAL